MDSRAGEHALALVWEDSWQELVERRTGVGSLTPLRSGIDAPGRAEVAEVAVLQLRHDAVQRVDLKTNTIGEGPLKARHF